MTQDQVPAAKLTAQERSFVNLLLRGVAPQPAARSLGMNPNEGLLLIQEPHIQYAIKFAQSMLDPTMYQTVQNIEFTKDMATVLYLEAHKKSKDATEEIKAVDSLVKLHGLAAPEKKEVEIKHEGQLREMSDAELQKLAGNTIVLEPESYEVQYGSDEVSE